MHPTTEYGPGAALKPTPLGLRERLENVSRNLILVESTLDLIRSYLYSKDPPDHPPGQPATLAGISPIEVSIMMLQSQSDRLQALAQQIQERL